jgi:hypothetical protein
MLGANQQLYGILLLRLEYNLTMYLIGGQIHLVEMVEMVLVEVAIDLLETQDGGVTDGYWLYLTILLKIKMST